MLLRAVRSGVYVIILVLSFVFLLATGHTQAQGVNDFTVESFSANLDLTNEDPQGKLSITEAITIRYDGQNQGFLRAIPITYKGNDLNVTVQKVQRDYGSDRGVNFQDEPFITYEENDNKVLRIGRAGTFLTGHQSYFVEYTVENVIGFYDGHDELFWDINGDQSLQPFTVVRATVNHDAPVHSTLQPECFTGAFGSTDSNCTVTEGTQFAQYETTESLGPGETLTIVRTFEKGYFTEPTFWEKYRKYTPAAIIVVLQLFVARGAYKTWRKFGKDDPSRGVTAPYFERPKGVSVMQASYVADNTLTPKHISASIIDLAVRGYVKIRETDDKKPKHELELLKLADKKLTGDEAKLLSSLFTGKSVGEKVKLEDKKNKLYKTTQELKKMLDTSTTKKGLFILSPTHGHKKFAKHYVLGVVMALVGFIAGSVSFGVTAIVGGLLLLFVIVLGALMSKRSQEGNYLKEHMAGLKLYLSKAEKDRIAAQDAVAAPLAPNRGQPVRDVKFFEKLLPFAVAHGVEKSWASAFQDIYTQAPDWYQGNWNTFSTAALASSLGSTTKVASTTFSSPSSSGGSGSGGGGFSGGGGGGGGVGGW